MNSIKRLKAKSVSASRGFTPLTRGSTPGPDWRLHPQTPVMEVSQLYLGASNSLVPALI